MLMQPPKPCALCQRTTSPKNGVTTSADAVLCHLCLATYETSHEYRREQHFKKAGHDGGARAALNDFIMTTLKIRQVEREREQNEKALAEKKVADEKKATEASTKNGVEKKPEVRA